MRVIQALGFYFPDSTGGTEVYVASLAKELRALGVASVIAAPSAAERPSEYVHDGARVVRYPVPAVWQRPEVRGDVPPRGFAQFESWLAAQDADIYHQHSWTTACGAWHLRTARKLGLKTVVTVHLPSLVCLRGTMLREGRAECDGEIIPERCGRCWLTAKGVPAMVAGPLAALPQQFALLLEVPKVGAALAASSLAARHGRTLHDLTDNADHVVAVCEWLRAALLANGVPAEKLSLNRQGVSGSSEFGPRPRRSNDERPLKVGFLGRWDPLKGLHVLVQAFRRLPDDMPVELHVAAIGGEGAFADYRRAMMQAAASDPRIRFLDPVPHADVPAFLASLDMLAVPSQWLETGPLVVLEAFAAGTPVLGSRLGGIRELVTDGRDGLLVAHDDVGAWKDALGRLATKRDFISTLQRGIGDVRTPSDVARNMKEIYERLNAARVQSVEATDTKYLERT